jgi:hypothetical protein
VKYVPAASVVGDARITVPGELYTFTVAFGIGICVKLSTTRPMMRCCAERPVPDSGMRSGDAPGDSATSTEIQTDNFGTGFD